MTRPRPPKGSRAIRKKEKEPDRVVTVSVAVVGRMPGRGAPHQHKTPPSKKGTWNGTVHNKYALFYFQEAVIFRSWGQWMEWTWKHIEERVKKCWPSNRDYHKNRSHSTPVADSRKTEMKEIREIKGRGCTDQKRTCQLLNTASAPGNQSIALHIAYWDKAQFYVVTAW
jgi:hypothetical protein